MVVAGQANLLEIVLALHSRGRFADLLNGGQQEADQDRDDRDHHQQFDERERKTTVLHGRDLRQQGKKKKGEPNEEKTSNKERQSDSLSALNPDARRRGE